MRSAIANISGALLIVLCGISFNAQSAGWVSPTEEKYQKSDDSLYDMYKTGQSLLDSYSGNQGNLRRARDIFDEILRIKLDYAPVYREFGRLHMMTGHRVRSIYKAGSLESSESSILKAIEIEPEYEDAYVLLGSLYITQKRLTEAEKALETAQRLGSRIAWLDLNWGRLRLKQKRYVESLSYYKTAIKSDAGTKKARREARSSLAWFYRVTKDYKKSKEWYQKAIDFDPDFAWGYGNYGGFLLFKVGDVEASVYNFEKALSIMNYGVANLGLACAYYTQWANILMQGDVKASEIAFNKAYSYYPSIVKIIKKTDKYYKTRHTANLLKLHKQ